MPIFRPHELSALDISEGAYSVVTKREATGDKSVTIDKYEKEILFSFIPIDEIKRVGGVKDDGKQSHHIFRVYQSDLTSFVEHEIALKLPKREGNELRLYFSRPAEFYPDSENIWLIFRKDGVNLPCIATMTQDEWDSRLSGNQKNLAFITNYQIDDEDDQYQKAINSPISQQAPSVANVTRYSRNPTFAKDAIARANYQCEIDASHETFISGSTGRAYLEAHHPIPVSRYSDFDVSLDVPANIVALCPNCHRAIHFAEQPHKEKLLKQIYQSRIKELKSSGLEVSISQLLRYYGVTS